MSKSTGDSTSRPMQPLKCVRHIGNSGNKQVTRPSLSLSICLRSIVRRDSPEEGFAPRWLLAAAAVGGGGAGCAGSPLRCDCPFSAGSCRFAGQSWKMRKASLGRSWYLRDWVQSLWGLCCLIEWGLKIRRMGHSQNNIFFFCKVSFTIRASSESTGRRPA